MVNRALFLHHLLLGWGASHAHSEGEGVFVEGGVELDYKVGMGLIFDAPHRNVLYVIYRELY